MDCCEDVKAAGHVGTLKLIFFVNLTICCFSRCMDRQKMHEKWAWETTWNIECSVLSQPGCWWWRLLSWRSPNTTNRRATRYWTQQTTMSGMMHVGTACSQSSRECCFFMTLHVLHLEELLCYYGPLLPHAIADTLYSSLALSWSPVKGIFNLISFGKEEKQD